MTNGKISLIGFGISNRAVYEMLRGYGYSFTVRSRDYVDVPSEIELIYGDGYLDTCEDMVFRSPSCMPYRITGEGLITSEVSFALSHIGCLKIGVTGSDGKTTVCSLIKHILDVEGLSAFYGGNNGYPLINYMGRLKEKDILVCELSSFQLIDLTPKTECAVITNITPNHMDIHSSHREYVGAKANILKGVKRAVLNMDCSETCALSSLVDSSTDITYATLKDMSKADFDRYSYVYPKNGWIYRNREAVLPMSCIKLRGEFNILNACLAIGAVYPYVGIKRLEYGVSTFEGVSHRMELIAEKNGVKYYDSSIDSTPSRTIATLSSFDKPRTAVILGGYDKSLSYDSLRDGLKGIKCAVICGANSEKIFRALSGICDTVLCDSFTESVKIASGACKVGDSVVLSPASASYDMFKNYKEKANKFKEIVRGL
ncbi:MAG: UDP-N-acetylmuramoyl-L-alanine--D-glutamate ligase [Clostridia bacterium]|nr:UDP-N-acetylmuramoyl-L-alanine--D-glutamate ligase [Clostridia bacterium]